MEHKIVEVKNLSHRYTVNWAIKDINFEIEKNGVFGLLGSNGAGKSTTMNIICNVLTQTQGDVFINGIDLRKNPIEAIHRIPSAESSAARGDDGGRIPVSLRRLEADAERQDSGSRGKSHGEMPDHSFP